jgi:hypothetical protein
MRRLGAIALLCVLACASPAGAATTRGRAILVENRPFFPIMQWSQCPNDFGSSLLLGIDVFMGVCEESSATEAAVTLGPFGYLIPPVALRGSLENARLLGWHQPDEPENNGVLPGDLGPLDRAHGPTFLTLTSEFMERARGPSAYRAYVARADVVGFDLYPVAAHCKSHIRLADVYLGQRDLLALAPSKPTYQWIETGPIDGRCPRGVTPEELRAEVWLAVAGGATGIGYFTHSWTRGDWYRFDVDVGIRAAIAETNEELRALAPQLLSPQLAAGATPPVYAGARLYRNSVYVIAVNASRAAATTTIRVKGNSIRAAFDPLEPRVFVLRN